MHFSFSAENQAGFAETAAFGRLLLATFPEKKGFIHQKLNRTQTPNKKTKVAVNQDVFFF